MKIGAFVYLNTYPDNDSYGRFVVLQHIKKPKNTLLLKEENLFKVIYSENNDEYNVGSSVILYSCEFIEVINKEDIEKYNKIVTFQ